jgi:hypothetical protein
VDPPAPASFIREPALLRTSDGIDIAQ